MRRVGVKEAAAVGPQHFYRFLRGHRPHRQHLAYPFKRGKSLIGGKALRYALLNKEQRDEQRNRQQQPEGDAGQVDPGVAQGADFLSGIGAGEGKDHRDAGGGGEEVLHRQPGHLAKTTHGGFTGIGLPVGVADKAHRRIQRQVPRQAGQMLRVERQRALERQQREQRRQSQRVKQQDSE